MTSIIYGLGGYDPDHPNGNVVEELVDNGDGTATVTVYDTEGKPVSVETVPYERPVVPLSDTEQLVALLTTKSVLSLDEAENLTGKRAELVAEAEAWAVAAEVKG